MKLHYYFFLLFILFLPSQLGLHFWPEFSFISGIRVDYLSPTLYFTDILAILTITTWLWSSSFKVSTKEKSILAIVVLFAFINIYYSLSPVLSLYKWLKIFEFTFIAFYIANLSQISINKIRYPLIAGGIFSSLLALAQFIKQSSIGGVFYYMGERSFSFTTPGIALMEVFGREYLRPYATFPHPNVLAAYLMILIILVFRKKLIDLILCATFFVNILISFSQNVWITTVIVFLLINLKFFRYKAAKLLPVLSVLISLMFLIFSLNLFSNFKDIGMSATERIKLAVAAGFIWSNSYLAGTGLGTFVIPLFDIYHNFPNLFSATNRWILQPVHNVYILIGVETGIVGLSLFYTLISKAYLHTLKNTRLYILLSVFLLLGLNDHYFMTLQQGLILTSLILGLSFSKALVE